MINVYYENNDSKIYNGNCLEVLKQLPDESIDCVVTSPPYWGLRDYGTAKWEGGDENCDHIDDSVIGGQGTASKKQHTNHGTQSIQYKDICAKCGAKRIDEQLGLESSFEKYISNLCDIFDEVKRVLKKDGTCWVNLGDTYNSSGSSGKMGRFQGKYLKNNLDAMKSYTVKKNTSNITEKSLCNIPSRFSIEMQNRGWILRNKIIWHKPSCMPSSIKDRFTVDYEEIFFFVKSKKYYFKQQFEPLADSSIKAKTYKLNQTTHSGASKSAVNVQLGNESRGERFVPEKGRNKRSVWKISVKPFKGAHFATYPTELIKTCIDAGCSVSGIVLDPFFGAGTTAIECINQHKHYIGIELNKEYCDIAKSRIESYLNIIYNDKQKV